MFHVPQASGWASQWERPNEFACEQFFPVLATWKEPVCSNNTKLGPSSQMTGRRESRSIYQAKLKCPADERKWNSSLEVWEKVLILGQNLTWIRDFSNSQPKWGEGKRGDSTLLIVRRGGASTSITWSFHETLCNVTQFHFRRRKWTRLLQLISNSAAKSAAAVGLAI